MSVESADEDWWSGELHRILDLVSTTITSVLLGTQIRKHQRVGTKKIARKTIAEHPSRNLTNVLKELSTVHWNFYWLITRASRRRFVEAGEPNSGGNLADPRCKQKALCRIR